MKNILAALAVLAALTTAASADRAATEGLTMITLAQEANTFTWTLRHNTIQQGHADFDILIWSLKPEGMPKPQSWSAPEGWVWSKVAGGSFTLQSANQKYKVGGPALEPGETTTFTYTISPLMLPQVANSENMQFISHVGAVFGNDGTTWHSAETDNGRTWHDRPTTRLSSPVPEPSGILALAFGSVSFAGLILRIRDS